MIMNIKWGNETVHGLKLQTSVKIIIIMLLTVYNMLKNYSNMSFTS